MRKGFLHLLNIVAGLTLLGFSTLTEARCMTDLYSSTVNGLRGQASYYYPATTPKQGCWVFDGYYGYNRCRCPVACDALEDCYALAPKYQEACLRYKAQKCPCNCLFDR